MLQVIKIIDFNNLHPKLILIEFGPCPSLGPRIVLFTEPRDYYDYYYDGQARKNYNYKWSGEQKL